MKNIHGLHLKRLKGRFLYILFTCTVPTVVFAGMTFQPGWVIALLKETYRIAKISIPLLIGIALLVFVWGVIMFMVSDDDRARNEGKRRIVWGIIGLFIIISIWGLVQLVGTLMGIGGAKASAPQSYFYEAPSSGAGSGGSGGSCTKAGDPCPDGSGWSCASPCCPFSGLDPKLCLKAGD